jgi:hypothetical protein
MVMVVIVRGNGAGISWCCACLLRALQPHTSGYVALTRSLLKDRLDDLVRHVMSRDQYEQHIRTPDGHITDSVALK